MTTGQLLDQESTVTNVEAWVHLQNLEGTGGVDHYFPYSDVSVDIITLNLEVEFEEQELMTNFEEPILTVEFEEHNLEVTFEDENLDITVTC